MSTCFMDRELSWLQFNLRVLKEAGDKNVPLLERLKFISIYNSNMDEFFMVRIGTLMHRSVFFPELWDRKTGWDTLTQLSKACSEVKRQQEELETTYSDVVKELSGKGIDVVDFRKLSVVEKSMAQKIFSEIRQMISPQVVDTHHPMPFTWNEEIYLAASLERKGKNVLGIVSTARIPKYRVFEADGRQKVFIISELLKHFSKEIFKSYIIREKVLIRVTRNADVFMEDMMNEHYDFKKSMETLLRKRKRELPVRLQISGKISSGFKEVIEEKIGIDGQYVFNSSIPIAVGFGSLINPGPGMKYEQRHPVKNVKLNKGEYFRYLKKHDMLLSYPYQSMMPFIDMLYEAADDPKVLSIKITLYRLSESSKVAAALAYAAEKGKEVLCLLELRARFDEQNNIDYSVMLEDAGCRIIYGLPGYKVHSKICLITRDNGKELEYYTQLGTGNYNEVTSEQYADLSVITSDRGCGEDAARVFEALSTGILPVKQNSLLVAPYSYKMPVLELMEAERAKGKDGRISIKVNSMNDMDIMEKLIDCSKAGVKVELFVRGICCLKPGIPELTENIKVYSIVGRYLEHSRIFMFGTGEGRKIYVGSGDLLNRNTQRRVEAFIEIKKELEEQVLEVMEAYREDNLKKWEMLSDGTYIKPCEGKDKKNKKEKAKTCQSSQERLYEYFSKRIIDNTEIKEAWYVKIFRSIFQ